MKINRNNYEVFFIDYLDGKLSRSAESELMAFLIQNPDLEEELNLVKNIKIKPERISYAGKKNLKKVSFPEISIEKFNELCVGKIEKTLSHEEEILLAQYLELNPEKVKDLQLFEKTVLISDTSIKFNNKESLKRIEISDEKFSELCIASIENEISKEDETVLTTYIIQNPLLKKEWENYNKTIVKPDLSIQYPDKQSLKRNVNGVFYKKILITSLSAAAAVTLFILAYTFFNSTGKHGNLPEMYATSVYPLNYKEAQKNTLIDYKTDNKMAIIKNNTVKNNVQMQLAGMDTSHYSANINNVLKQDSSLNVNKVQNLPKENNENYLAINQNNDHNHDNFDKPYAAVFTESKYSHFRDMTESVPFESIQPYASGLGNVTVWDVIEESSKGISAVTGAEIDIKKKSNKKQRTENYSFRIGRFGFARTVHNK